MATLDKEIQILMLKGQAGDKGSSIERIEKTSTSGLVDTYTVYLSDGTTTTFTVTNGADGEITQNDLDDAINPIESDVSDLQDRVSDIETDLSQYTSNGIISPNPPATGFKIPKIIVFTYDPYTKILTTGFDLTSIINNLYYNYEAFIVFDDVDTKIVLKNFYIEPNNDIYNVKFSSADYEITFDLIYDDNLSQWDYSSLVLNNKKANRKEKTVSEFTSFLPPYNRLGWYAKIDKSGLYEIILEDNSDSTIKYPVLVDVDNIDFISSSSEFNQYIVYSYIGNNKVEIGVHQVAINGIPYNSIYFEDNQIANKTIKMSSCKLLIEY